MSFKSSSRISRDSQDFEKQDLVAILEGVSDGVLKLDRDAKYVALNRAASEIVRQLGRDPTQVIGKSLWNVFPEARGTIVERELNKVFEDACLLSTISTWLQPSGGAGPPRIHRRME